MALKATQKKLALQKQIGVLKKELALQKRIENLEIKNHKLEQKLKLKKNEKQKITFKLPINTHLAPVHSLASKEEKARPKQEKKAENVRWMNPVLTALKELGGSGTSKEVIEKVAKNEKISDEVRGIKLKNGSSKFDNQVMWARLYLVYEGLLDGSKRGVWTLTPSGEKTTLTEEEARKIRSKNDMILKELSCKKS